MRVGFDITPLRSPKSGVGTYTLNIFEHLQTFDDVEVLPLSHERTNKTLWMQVFLPFASRKFGFDLCHFTNNVSPVYMPCPTILTIHDTTLWKFPEFHYYKRLISMRPLIPIAARRAAAVITVSTSAKNDIVETLGISAHKVHVIYEAAALNFCPISPDEARARVNQRYSLPEKFILFVGTLEPRKNLTRLIKAFSTLHHQGLIPHHLILIGSKGWKTEEIFETIEGYQLQSVVHHLGYVPQDDLVDLMNLADAMVFPSFYEGFGLPVVEAMACGTPVITTRNGALAEVADQAAEFVEPLDVDSIAQGMYRVLSDRDYHNHLRTAGFINARRFNWRSTVEQTLEVYKLIIS